MSGKVSTPLGAWLAVESCEGELCEKVDWVERRNS